MVPKNKKAPTAVIPGGIFVPNTFVVARTKAVLHLLTIPRRLQIRGLHPLRIVLRLTLKPL
jgi:hypothetical protein